MKLRPGEAFSYQAKDICADLNGKAPTDFDLLWREIVKRLSARHREQSGDATQGEYFSLAFHDPTSFPVSAAADYLDQLSKRLSQ
jgi:hypothetical protein